MAAEGAAGSGLVESGPSRHHFPHAVCFEVDDTTTSFINQGHSFDFEELEEAIVLQGVGLRKDEAKDWKPATLEIFPSWPGSSKSRGESSDLGSSMNKITVTSSTAEGYSEHESPISKKFSSASDNHGFDQNVDLRFRRPEKKKRTSSKPEKLPDAKTSRRLAQNRAAAKKSRLRKKAYIQQLEASRMKLSQIEQDLRRSHSQGLFSASYPRNGSGDFNVNITGGVVFDVEYTRWLEDDRRQTTELRSGLEAHLSDNDLRLILNEYISHYDEIFRLKGAVAKSDVFNLITGKWITPVERYFLWMGGFRPSELIKILMSQLDPLSQQQAMEIYKLQNSTQQAEEALSQGQEQLQQSLLNTIAGGLIINGMNQMLTAVGKLSNLEGLVRQADILRQQTLHQLCRILTTRQAAQCFVVIGEYYSRLRALDSIWATRPQEALMNDGISCQTIMQMQMIIEPSQNLLLEHS